MTENTPSNHIDTDKSHKTSFVSNPWFYALLSCFLLLILLGARFISSYDLGFHLKGGQWILENLQIPYQDSYTYTVAGRDYLDIHWLYQVGLYLLYLLGGYSMISIANIALIFLTFALVFKRMGETGAPFWMRVILLGVVLMASENRFVVRPEITSWFLMCLMLWVLEGHAKGNRNHLFLLPVIQILWANSEGLAGIGWVLMLFFVLSGYLVEKRPDVTLAKYSLLALALSLVNPNFIRGALYPLSHMVMLGPANLFKQTINELQSPWTWPGYNDFGLVWTLWVYKFFSLFLLVILLATWRKRYLHDFFLVGAFFWLSAVSLRNIPLFMLACSPLAAACWNDLKWGWIRKIHSEFFSRPLAAWVFVVFMLGVSLRVVTGAFYVAERQPDRFGLELNPERQPVLAARFLTENRLDGGILNHLSSGGWLDWMGPQKIFIDGRLETMGEEFYAEYMSSFRPGGLAPLLAKYGVEIVFFNPDSAPPWLFQLAEMPEWRPVYLDEAAVIFLKKGYAPQVPALDDERLLAEKGVHRDILREAPTLMQMLKPSAWNCFWEEFYRPVKYSIGLNTVGDYYSYSGRFGMAEAVFLENIKRTNGRYWDLYFNLGAMYYRAGRTGEAVACLRRVLKDAPGFTNARKLLADMGQGAR